METDECIIYDKEFENFILSIKNGNIKDEIFEERFLSKSDKYGLQAIHWTILSYNIDALKWILEKKCSIESWSKNGWRPIHFAVFVGDEEMVKFLIGKYCKLDCQTDSGKTISDFANGDYDREFIDEILNENINLKIALSMGLKCGVDCDHRFCWKSVIRGDFYKGEIIGEGSFGNGNSLAKVYKMRESQNDRIFAVKIIRKYEYDEFDDTKYILSNLNRYLRKLNHENIVKYFGMIETRRDRKIFMECMEKGSLEKEIESTGSLSDDKIARYCKDILQAVAFLHHNKIIHRDIKPPHILIDNNDKCKLSMPIFSCLLAKYEIADTFCGTLNNMAPEILNGEPYNYPVDIWSVGATVVHMLTGHPPYNGLITEAVVSKIARTKKLEYKFPRQISNEMQKLINDMTKAEPHYRATADQLLNYKLIRNAPTHNEINKSNIDQSIIDYSAINRENCKNLINSAINNHKIGLSMELKCPDGCEHMFCLSSVTAHNFRKGEKIGSGAFGKVYKINKSSSSPELVIKTIRKVKDNDIEKEAKCLEYNINQYRDNLIHENIVKYFGAINNEWKIFIFMEFIDGESISMKISLNNYQPLQVKFIKKYTTQILIGLKFLHQSAIIHRDIKSANILITKQDCIKIVDFGLSRLLQTVSRKEQKTFCGTVYYTSPEVINDEPYGFPADIWSVGATVFEMATGRPPYHSVKNEIAIGIKIATTKKLENSKILEKNEETKQFIDLMTKDDPNERWTADQLLTHPYLK